MSLPAINFPGNAQHAIAASLRVSRNAAAGFSGSNPMLRH